MATYERCGHKVTPDVVDAGYELKCPVCRQPVSYIRNATDEPEYVWLPDKEQRHIERR